MDAENGELFLSHEDEQVVLGQRWNLDAAIHCSDVIFSNSEKPLQEWAVDCTLNDSESEDVLHAVDPNEVFPSGPPGEALSETDSGISEDPPADGPITAASAEPAQHTLYQVVYDINDLRNVTADSVPTSLDVISIQLDEWSSQTLFSDSCIVNEVPVMSAASTSTAHTLFVSSTAPSSPDNYQQYSDLQLTEEEQKLLTQEGISLPSNLPLTKAEERILKKVRRKIRNKQSAQDSRRRRKEYIDGLESRAAACSAQNKDLQRTVEQLEKHNRSLVAQLHRFQSLIKQTVSKGAQTSTCVLIILLSLALIIMPSFSPFRGGTSSEEDYKPTGVISRNILIDLSSSPPATDEADGRPNLQAVSLPVPAQMNQSASPDSGTILKQPTENLEITDFVDAVQEESLSRNETALVSGRTEPLALGLRSVAGKGSLDTTKPAHADEM
ncbi:cyclic AMP-responsive element-binding protein 3-like protein 4 [Lampris incognitus]|uniref:cyclic AMP-responsive element-binding protein 3-like protein 4 n=1 Tax=Lampris incognitus TaxID=2546036 RepID=UPI0024B5C1AC|nr:cyclic AMP-responsive element-binding protein 3-like protein 4 [Lampris incognitus]